jgi:hypothetical protein
VRFNLNSLYQLGIVVEYKAIVLRKDDDLCLEMIQIKPRKKVNMLNFDAVDIFRIENGKIA